MRAKFKVLSGERLCKKAFGANLGEFESKRVKKNFGVGISLSLSLSLVSASTLCAECA